MVGVTLQLLANPDGFARRMRARYGDIYRVHSFGRRQVAMVGAEANELVLFDREHIFSSEQGWGPILNLLFPRGLMLMDFERHRADRRALSVAFKPEPMRRFARLIDEGVARAVADWGGERRVYPAMKTLMLDVAARAFLGLPWGPEMARINRAFVDMVQASVGVVRRPLPFTKMGRGVAGRRFLINYFTPLVAQRRARPGDDMLSRFAEARREDGGLLAVDEVVDHMNFLLMAAHDTTTSAATSLLWLLARHPDWQERLREEVRGVADADGHVAAEELPKLELTEWAFKEALRLIPPVPSTPRRALWEFTVQGIRVPAGTVVNISAAAVHRMAEHWPDPDRFDPLRFTPEAVRGRHKYAWVPFGGGPHMCLGLHFATMQMRILMAHLLTRYRIEVPDDYEPKWQLWPIPRPRDGLLVRFVPLG